MRRLAGVGVLAVVILASAPVAAQSRHDVAAAWAIVLAQLEAFRRGDFDAAYTFASTEIRRLFDRERFQTMVATGYPEIAQSVSAVVTQGEVAADGHVDLIVSVYGANGKAVEALYEMVQEDAQWKVNGVVAKPAPGPV